MLLYATAALLASAPPHAVAVQGSLTKIGDLAVDGAYHMTVTLYDAEADGTALWTHTYASVASTGGVFDLALEGLDPAVFAGAGDAWIGIKVEGEPELPRRRVLSVPQSLVSATSLDLACTGCVGESDLADSAVTGPKLAFACADGEVLGVAGGAWGCEPLPKLAVGAGLVVTDGVISVDLATLGVALAPPSCTGQKRLGFDGNWTCTDALPTPPTCGATERLAWDGGWKCVPAVTAPPTCAAGKKLQYDGGWSCVAESDPKVGTLSDGKWCRTSGGVVTCDQNDPSASSVGGIGAWVRFRGDTCSTTCTIEASKNVSSVTRTNTGRYTINFTSAVSLPYVIAGSVQFAFSATDRGSFVGPADAASPIQSGSVAVEVTRVDSNLGTYHDAPVVHVVVIN